MDNSIRIQDDLYTYVNQEKLDQLVIPDDKPYAGGFAELSDEVEKTLMEEFRTLEKSGEIEDENMKKAVALYAMAANVKKRNKQGIKPIAKDLKLIQATSDLASFKRKLKNFYVEGFPLPFVLDVDVDFKDSNKYSLFLYGPSTFLPDTTMYSPQNPRKDMMIGLWKDITAKVLAYTDLSPEEQATYIEDAIAFDAIIATLVKSREELSEYTKLYNPYKANKVNRLLAPIKLKTLLRQIYGFVPETIIVADPRFLDGFKTLFNEENYQKYQHWAYIKMLLGNGPFLSEELRDLCGAFARALTGAAKMTEPRKNAYQLVGRYFDQPVGLYYGKKYFGEAAKRDVEEMVGEIISAYKERIKTNDILSEPTKEKAILKLNTMKVKIGYPEKIEDIYDKLAVNPRDALYKTIQGLRKTLFFHKVEKLTQAVDKSRWAMPGHMVNACYDPTSNDITFPAAILQAPFYAYSQTRSQNLGGIGAVIGHEISHAFDNNGAKCDEFGNLNNWWTKEDFRKFEKKTKAMIDQFDGIELPWGKVNAKLIVSENIADNGGMAVSLHIMRGMKEANYEEYFCNWARVWCQKAKPEFKSLLLTVDVHGPVLLRANMPPRNFQEWYDTFGVTSKDKMYIPPKKRLIIW